MLEQASACLDGAQTFIMQLNGDAKAAMDFVRELARAGGKRLLGAVHVQRQADNHVVRLPLFEQALNKVPVRRAVVSFQRRERAGGAGDR